MGWNIFQVCCLIIRSSLNRSDDQESRELNCLCWLGRRDDMSLFPDEHTDTSLIVGICEVMYEEEGGSSSSQNVSRSMSNCSKR